MPFITKATYFGFSLDYDGDDNFSSSVSCGHDLDNVRLQSALHLNNNLEIQPNFVALPLYSSEDSKTKAELKAGFINWHAQMAFFTYKKYSERAYESKRRKPEEALKDYHKQKPQISGDIDQAKKEINNRRNNI